MSVVSTPLIETAEDIFTRLGYTVTEAGSELRAERKWRVVYVTADPPEEASERGDLRCFVTTAGEAADRHEELLALAPDYDWAVMGVGPEGDYWIHHPTESEAFPS